MESKGLIQFSRKVNCRLNFIKHYEILKKTSQLILNYNQSIKKALKSMNKELSLKQAQQIVDEWINTTGVRYFDEMTNTVLLMEEVGEVARIMARKYGEQSFKESDKDIDLADEFADVLFVLICLANQTGVDLTEAFQKNFEKKNRRDGERHEGNEKLKS